MHLYLLINIAIEQRRDGEVGGVGECVLALDYVVCMYHDSTYGMSLVDAVTHHKAPKYSFLTA